MLFLRSLAEYETQTASFRIWTRMDICMDILDKALLLLISFVVHFPKMIELLSKNDLSSVIKINDENEMGKNTCHEWLIYWIVF